MDVYLAGKKIGLHHAEFKGQGGEGAVYIKGGTAFKIYADPQKMIPHAKIQQLAVLTRPEIVRPREVLTDARQTPVGYTMTCVPDAWPLCQTFSKAFRDRHGLTPDRALRLVQRLQEGVAHVHGQGILIVDLNETNFLIDAALETVYFIDVDSYQTPGFPATALMDSVRDRHSHTFSTGTDWFSFAVVSFQMFAGIHPYKGKHPSLKTLEARMQANVSVLNKDVSVPTVCPPFDVIPSAYREWYRAVLDGGQRCPPPDGPQAVLILAPRVTRPAVGSSLFEIEELAEFDADIIGYAQGLVVTERGVVFGGRTVLGSNVRVGVVPQNGHAVAAWMDRDCVRFYDLNAGQELTADVRGEDVMGSDGRLYVRQGPSLLEVEFVALPATTLVTVKTIAHLMEQATQLFEGVAFQNMLGAWYATLLPRRGKAYQIRLPELDGAQIVEARFDNGVLMLVTAHNGRYDKLILRFDDDYQSYDVRRLADVPAPSVNFVALGSGVCLHLNENDELEVFSRRKGAAGLKVFSDPALAGDCRLFKNGSQALFARGALLHKFTMRQT